MADDDSTTSTALTAPTGSTAARPARQVMVVEDTISLFDTAKFEHFGRIAAVMASAPLIPEGLRGDSREEAVGNCFLVVSMADRLRVDPFMLAQCCSVVHGRLMMEGKVFGAVLKARLDIDLNYYFTGEIGTPEYRVYVCDQEFTDELIAQLKPGFVPPGYRMIDGCVGGERGWQTYDKGGKVNRAWLVQPDMQLTYRGERTWCRRYESGLMLGIYTDDEVWEIEEQRAAVANRRAPKPKADLQGKLAGPGQGQGEGFSEAHIARETGQGGNDTVAAPETAQDAQDTAPAGFDTLTGEVDATEPAAGQDSVQGGASDDSVAGSVDPVVDIPADDAAADDAQEDEDWPFSKQYEGPAPAGQVYQLVTDEPGDDGKMQTYKDGQPHQRYNSLACEQIPLYDDHPEGTARPTETGGVQAAETGPGSSASATDASGATAAATSGQAEAERPSNDGAKEPDAPAEGGFMAEIQALKTWADITDRLKVLYKTPEWVALPDDDKDAVRAAVWRHVDALIKAGTIKLDFVTEPAAFNLWQATMEGKEGADAIEGNLGILKKEPKFLAMKAEQQERLINTALLRINKLKGKG